MNKEISIFDLLITRDMEVAYEDIGKKLKNSKPYNDSIKEIHEKLSHDTKLKIEVCDIVSVIETEAQDAAYSQGFSDAVKLIMSCMNNGGGYCG